MKMCKGVEIQVHALLSLALLEVSDELHTLATSSPGNQPSFSFVRGAERVLYSLWKMCKKEMALSLLLGNRNRFLVFQPTLGYQYMFPVIHDFARCDVCWLLI
jgi:hypothetical protein